MKGNITYHFLWVGLLACINILQVRSQEVPAPANDQVKINGTVVSIVDNAPIEGVNVRIEGISGIFRDTDGSGKFSIGAPSRNVTLIITYPGYRALTQFVGHQEEMLVKLVPETYPSTLDPVVLTPGNIRQKRFTSQSYQTMAENDFADRPYVTMEGYAHGKIAGVNVTGVNGMPGAASSVNIRGVSSMMAGSQPLYIVDGMEVSNIEYIKSFHTESFNTNLYNSILMGLNINDIQSVSFLKDVAAKAVYGSRGGNGVVIIETAKGQKGNSRIDLIVNQGFEFKGKDIPMLNADENRQYLTEMAYSQYNDGQAVINKYGHALFNDPSSLYYQTYNNSTNWPDVIQKNAAYYGDYHFRIRGGDDVAKYSFSVGLLDKDGIIENTGMNRLSARFHLDYDVTEWLRIGANLYFVRMQQDRQPMGFSNYNPLLLAYRKSPMTTPFVQDARGTNTPVYESYDAFSFSNPLALSRLTVNEYANNLMGGKMFGEFYISKDLTVALSLGLNNQTAQDKLFIPEQGVFPLRDMYRISEQTYVEDMLFDGRLEVRYNTRFGELHTFGTTLGANYLNDQLNYRLGRSYNSGSDDFTSLGQGDKDLPKSYTEEWRMLAGYLQSYYMFKDRYIADLVMRVDGSSRFGKNNRAVFYPALALAWRIGEENFMSSAGWVDELKLRGSAGYAGNDNIGNHSSRLLYVPGNYKNLGGVSFGQLANEDLEPERILEYDLGLDMGIFNQRISLSVDFYDRTTTNMIVPVNIPLESGSSAALMNDGRMNNRGVEITAGYYQRSGDFTWSIGGNIAFNKNEVTKMPGSTPAVLSQYNEFTVIAADGQPTGTYYGYRTNGVFATDEEASAYYNGREYRYEPFKGGDIRFADQNGDNTIDEKDMVYLGKSLPDIIGGISLQVSWKGFTLNAVADAQIGREVVNGMRYQLESMKDYGNQTVAVNRRWRQPGDVTGMPRLAYDDPAGNSRFSDRWVEDGSFYRLRNLSLGYDFPVHMIQKIRLNRLRVFISAENVLTYSKYLGLDPEFNHLNNDFISGIDAASMYVPRSITFGIRLGL